MKGKYYPVIDIRYKYLNSEILESLCSVVRGYQIKVTKVICILQFPFGSSSQDMDECREYTELPNILEAILEHQRFISSKFCLWLVTDSASNDTQAESLALQRLKHRCETIWQKLGCDPGCLEVDLCSNSADAIRILLSSSDDSLT